MTASDRNNGGLKWEGSPEFRWEDCLFDPTLPTTPVGDGTGTPVVYARR